MNTLLKNSVVAATLILASSTLMNCDKKQAVQKESEIAITTKNDIDFTILDKIETRKPLVFITGYDKGNETFYNNARSVFQEKQFEIVEDQYSLEEIINWLNTNATDKAYGEIHIVNKSDPHRGMSLETTIKGETVSTESLRRSITKGTLPFLNESVNADSKIIFHANGLGENTALMKTFKDAFCSDELPNVIASPYHSIFDGEFTKHYLAKPYYVYYPTAHSPGKVDLSKEIAKKYTEEKDIDWLEALNNTEERFVGEAYTKQFTIPIQFSLDYHNSDDEVPTFDGQDELMDFIEQQESLISQVKKLNIPIEKYRWTYNLKNSTLVIKGKTSVVCVLKPLIRPYGELQHIQPDTNNKRLYAMK
ncbi:hypothetical protein [Polaribacter porphyrae]|uniref:Lipoprotein n=1 Tax=Polaribacter porphyrae TaxID=1137780 RepID=A0A2S7WLP2_9FLAO|nr:hypothetical protein [Polaribacter porphyrae]PQJ78386.1 hypothetical protein BTO18_03895 [Polaribacter porphyrae]